MHIKTILGAKLDCVGANYEVADEARALKDAAFAACDLVDASDADTTVKNAEQLHETLHDLQEWATAICDEGTKLSREQLCCAMNDYKEILEALVQ